MENDWELDDVPPSGTCPDGILGCDGNHVFEDGPPMAHWLDIGEPDAASLDWFGDYEPKQG